MLSEAIENAMNFHGLIPTDINENCGTVWFTDKETGKRYFIMIEECENTIEGDEGGEKVEPRREEIFGMTLEIECDEDEFEFNQLAQARDLMNIHSIPQETQKKIHDCICRALFLLISRCHTGYC
ncbi:hypothetical protein CMI47_21555 [Candidatus Pacearchaeota archaeon]|nr:hypothetical protein [Candidatus Pacearchaeota archaeon]